MTITTDTSAGRLWNILHFGNEMSKEMSKRHTFGPSDTRTIQHILATLFGFDQTDKIRVVQVYGALLNLLSEVDDDIKRLYGENASLYRGPLVKISQGLSRAKIEDEWSVLWPFLDEAAMSGLALAAQNLKEVNLETQISEEELQKLLKQIDELTESVYQSSIGTELRNIFLRGLEELRRAVIDYKISGSINIERAAQGTFGAIVLSADKVRTAEEKEKVKDVLAIMNIALNLVNVGRHVYNLVAAATGLPQLPA